MGGATREANAPGARFNILLAANKKNTYYLPAF
jgi:hypothetical protein